MEIPQLSTSPTSHEALPQQEEIGADVIENGPQQPVRFHSIPLGDISKPWAEYRETPEYKKQSQEIAKEREIRNQKWAEQRKKTVDFLIPILKQCSINELEKGFIDIETMKPAIKYAIDEEFHSDSEVFATEAIIRVLWKKLDGDFQKKFSMIQRMHQCIVGAQGEYESQDAGYENSLQFIAENEENFFLKYLVKSFSEEKSINPSLGERRQMIRDEWEEHYESNDVAAWIWLYKPLVSYEIPAQAHSVDDLSEKDIIAITNEWIRQDEYVAGHHMMQERAITNSLRDKNLGYILTKRYLQPLESKDAAEEICYDLDEAIGDLFTSSISPEFAATYSTHDGTIQEIFKKNDSLIVQPSLIATELPPLSRFFINLKQGRPEDAKGLREDINALSFFMAHPELKDEAMQYIDLLFDSNELFTENFTQACGVLMDSDGSMWFEKIFASAVNILRDDLLPLIPKTSSVEEILEQDYTLHIGDIGSSELSKLYVAFSSTRMRVFLEKYFGFSFSDIPLNSQLQFLKYVWDKDEATMTRVQEFVCQAKDPRTKSARFVSFLAVEQFGDEMGKKILTIGNQLPQEISDILFQKYSEIIEMTNQSEEVIRSLTKKSSNTGVLPQVQIALVQRANALLLTSHQKLEAGEIEKLQKELDQIHADTILFNSIFRNLKESGAITDFSELNGLNFIHAKIDELTSEDQKIMIGLYDENYPEGTYTPTFRNEIFHGLEESFKNPGAVFHILKKGGKVIAFDRFETLPASEDDKERKYWGSFNVALSHRGSKIGEAFLEQSLAREKTHSIIEAYADPAVLVSQHYIEKDGFVATGIEMIGDRPLLKIVFDEDFNDKLRSKKTDSLSQDPSILENVSSGFILHTKTNANEIPDFSPLKKGFVLTRFFKTEKNTLCVFEKPPQEKIPQENILKTA